MMADAGPLRISTKRTARQMQFESGAPGTRSSQSLWVNRLNSFRTDILRQDTETPFNGEDLVRFLDAIMVRMINLLSIIDGS